MDVGGRAPKAGALGDAGAIAGKAGMMVLNKKRIWIGITYACGEGL